MNTNDNNHSQESQRGEREPTHRLSRLALPVALVAAIAAVATAVAIAATSSSRSTTVVQTQPGTMPQMNMSAPPGNGAPAPVPYGAAPGGGGSASSPHGNLPAGTDLAKYLGQRLAGNGQQAVSRARAEALANEMPASASVDTATRTVRFTTRQVSLVVVASPPSADMKFRTAGIDNPTIVVPANAQITLEFINGDSDMAHMWLLQTGDPGPAAVQPGSGGGDHIAAAPPLGDPTAAGQPAETVTFTASPAGTYHYDCPFPGHATQGMYGRFVVQSA